MLQVSDPTSLFESMLNVMDFKLVKGDDFYGLLDLQGANLGDIESERFTSASQLVERLDIYIADYFLTDLEEEFEVWCRTSNPSLWEDFGANIVALGSCED